MRQLAAKEMVVERGLLPEPMCMAILGGETAKATRASRVTVASKRTCARHAANIARH